MVQMYGKVIDKFLDRFSLFTFNYKNNSIFFNIINIAITTDLIYIIY